ncbi:MAG: hypothetical protein ACPF8V_09340 [Luteibaculum sp.]
MRVLLADSGGSKTAWALLDKELGKVSYHQGRGLNPNVLEKAELEMELKAIADAFGNVESVEFYGAGCSTAGNASMLKALLQSHFVGAQIHVSGDLLCAAKAVLGKKAGIVGILGTGSNSAYFNGGEIVKSRPSYGYLLGDEGSGTAIGKRFLKAAIENELSANLQKLVKASFSIGEEEVVDKLYHQKIALPKYFGSFTPFVAKHMPEFPELSDLVKQEFQLYVKYFLNVYENANQLPVGMVGSIAWYFQQELREVLAEASFQLIKVEKSPLEALVKQHLD